jgi:tRNA-specific 2-thiouridylase
VPDGDYAGFIRGYSSLVFPKGNFIDASGKILGEHQGIIGYTVGQRKGLGIALGRPMFVTNKDISSNTVTLGDEPELFYKRVEVRNVNFIPFDGLSSDMRVGAKLRYRHAEQNAVIHPTGEKSVIIEFEKPQRAPSPGQAAVFYDGEYVVGGGIIERGI